MLAQITNTPHLWQFLHYSKDAFSSIESVVKIIAIIIGAFWAYGAFHRRREKYPRAKITQTVSYWPISETERLLRVTLNLVNDSDVLLKVSSGFTWVQQMRPWPPELLTNLKEGKLVVCHDESEVGWPWIKECIHKDEKEIEPKETDEIHMDFVLDKLYEQVLVYSFIENAAKKPKPSKRRKKTKERKRVGWPISTIVTFDEESKPENLIIMSEQIPDKRQGQPKSRPAAVQPIPKQDIHIQSQPKEKPPQSVPPKK